MYSSYANRLAGRSQWSRANAPHWPPDTRRWQWVWQSAVCGQSGVPTELHLCNPTGNKCFTRQGDSAIFFIWQAAMSREPKDGAMFIYQQPRSRRRTRACALDIGG